MRNGFKVYDTDTHVMPMAEVLEQYVDPSFRPRLAELTPYRVLAGQTADGTAQHQYSVHRRFYRRRLGEAGPHATFTGRGGTWRGSKAPRPGVQDDQAANRVKDMDEEGADVHFLVPSSWTGTVGLDDTTLEVGLIRAYHRHMADFCGQFPERLKGMIVASTAHVDEAVREIRQWGTSKWAVAVMLLVRKPVDHPDLEPIWQAAQDHDLAVVHHSSTWNPPYFPGSQDVWENIFLDVWRHIPGAPCALWRLLLAAALWIATRTCAWVSWSAALAGCPSGPGAWTSRPAMWGARHLSSTNRATTSPAGDSSAALRCTKARTCSTASRAFWGTTC